MRVIEWTGRQRRVEWSGRLGGLPSGESAQALVAGDVTAVPVMVFHTALRAALIGIGMSVAGLRGPNLIKYSLAGAVGIELFVVTWALYERSRGKP